MYVESNEMEFNIKAYQHYYHVRKINRNIAFIKKRDFTRLVKVRDK